MGSGTQGALPKQQQQQQSTRKAVLAAALYFFTALALTVLNKAIFSLFGFRLVRLLGLGQLLAALLLQHALAALGYIRAPCLTARSLRACLPVAAASLGAQLSVFAAMRGTNLVMFGTLRRTNILFTLVAQRLFLGRGASSRVVASCLLVCCGALLAGTTDLGFDAYAYAMALLANVFSSAYLVLIKRSPVQLDSAALVYHCAAIGAPVLAAYCLAAGDFERLAEFEFLGSPAFQAVFGASVLLGFCINFATMLNTRVNSPLTQVVTGQTKGAFVLIVGVVGFRPAQLSTSTLGGAAVSFLGSVAYAATRYAETRAARAAADAGAKPSTPARADADAAAAVAKSHSWSDADRRRAELAPPAALQMLAIGRLDDDGGDGGEGGAPAKVALPARQPAARNSGGGAAATSNNDALLATARVDAAVAAAGEAAVKWPHAGDDAGYHSSADEAAVEAATATAHNVMPSVLAVRVVG